MVWLLGVVVKRYIDFIILLIPTPLVSVIFYSSIPTFCSNNWPMRSTLLVRTKDINMDFENEASTVGLVSYAVVLVIRLYKFFAESHT